MGLHRRMNICILTIERPQKTPYLDRLLATIRAEYKGTIHLMIGGKDTSYTDKYTKGYVKHYLWEEEKKLKDNIKRAALGYYKALEIDKTKPLLIFEDDGVLKKGWYKRLLKLRTFTAAPLFILSLITPSEGDVQVPNIAIDSLQGYLYRAFLDYKIPGHLPVTTVVTYSNTTGMYYPASVLQTRLAKYIYEFGVKGDAVHDILVGQYVFRYNIPVFIAVPNLLEKVDSTDSSLGSTKAPSVVDYSKWTYIKP